QASGTDSDHSGAYHSRYDSYRFQTPEDGGNGPSGVEPKSGKPGKPMNRRHKKVLFGIGLFCALIVAVIAIAYVTASLMGRSSGEAQTETSAQQGIVLGRQDEEQDVQAGDVQDKQDQDAAGMTAASESTAADNTDAASKEAVSDHNDAADNETASETEETAAEEAAASTAEEAASDDLLPDDDVDMTAADAAYETAPSLYNVIFSDGTGETYDVQTVVSMRMPSVVTVCSADGTSSVSGVIIGASDKALLVATAADFVSDDTLTVSFYDDSTAEAHLLGSAAGMAVLAVPSDGLTDELLSTAEPVPAADTAEPALGEEVVALGHTDTDGQTVYTGIVNAVYPDGAGPDSQLPETVRTSVPVSSENAGGPLLNLRGELVGINLLKDGEAANAASFASAYMNLLQETEGDDSAEIHLSLNAASSQETASVKDSASVYLGVSFFGPSEKAPQNDSALCIKSVNEESPAEQAGLHAEDCILAVNDTAVADFSEFKAVLVGCRPGDEVNFRVIRHDSSGKAEELTIAAVLAAKEEAEETTDASEDTDSMEEDILSDGTQKNSLSGSYFGLFEDNSQDFLQNQD
ncbi:MAG: S1C family serine protease, partial [Lachnospiraceae bacterium]|nr:S1C family serine protease [Lachnospiraceae bacterium]